MRISDWSSDVCFSDLDTLQFEERAFAEISGKIDIGIRQIGLAGRDEDRATDGVPPEEGALGTAKHLHATRQMGDRIDRVVLASVEGTDQTLKLPARTDAFLERVGALLQNDPKAVSLPPLPDLMRHVLAELEQESVEVTFVPDGGEESVTMTLGS